jgi:hypothetical protein
MATRVRTGLVAATVAAGIASVVSLAAPAWAGPVGAPGNNGTVKIHDGAGEPSPEPRNEPHVCTFHVHALHFDSGQVLTFTVQSWEPTGDRSVVLSGSITADATGEGRAPVTGTYGLPDGHYRLTVDTGNGTTTQDKHKMFWVRCAPETTPPPTSPGSPSPSCPSTGCPTSPSCPPSTECTTPPGPPSSPPPTSGGPSSGPPSSGAPTTAPGAGGIPPTPPGTPPAAGGLAFTGSSTAAVAGIGLGLLLAGLALLRIPATRRRLLGD